MQGGRSITSRTVCSVLFHSSTDTARVYCHISVHSVSLCNYSLLQPVLSVSASLSSSSSLSEPYEDEKRSYFSQHTHVATVSTAESTDRCQHPMSSVLWNWMPLDLPSFLQFSMSGLSTVSDSVQLLWLERSLPERFRVKLHLMARCATRCVQNDCWDTFTHRMGCTFAFICFQHPLKWAENMDAPSSRTGKMDAALCRLKRKWL